MVAFVIVGAAAPASPCSVSRLTTPTDLAAQAVVILRTRAERLSVVPAQEGPPGRESYSDRVLTVVSVLKGEFRDYTIP
jgi:hypothetical protein